MADAAAVYSITTLACQRWTQLLIENLAKQINDYLHHLFKLALKRGKEEGRNEESSLYGYFQRFCLGVADMPYDELAKRSELLEERVKNLQTTINTVVRLNYSVMSVVRPNDLRAIRLPKVSVLEFIKKCYQSSAAEVGLRNPHQFDQGITGSARMINYQNAHSQIKTVLMDVLMSYIPTDTITASRREIRMLSRSPSKSPKGEKSPKKSPRRSNRTPAELDLAADAEASPSRKFRDATDPREQKKFKSAQDFFAESPESIDTKSSSKRSTARAEEDDDNAEADPSDDLRSSRNSGSRKAGPQKAVRNKHREDSEKMSGEKKKVGKAASSTKESGQAAEVKRASANKKSTNSNAEDSHEKPKSKSKNKKEDRGKKKKKISKAINRPSKSKTKTVSKEEDLTPAPSEVGSLASSTATSAATSEASESRTSSVSTLDNQDIRNAFQSLSTRESTATTSSFTSSQDSEASDTHTSSAPTAGRTHKDAIIPISLAKPDEHPHQLSKSDKSSLITSPIPDSASEARSSTLETELKVSLAEADKLIESESDKDDQFQEEFDKDD